MMVHQPPDGRNTPRRAPWSCSRCDRRWTSLAQAHCVKCHQQFATALMADAHDRGGRCRWPGHVTTKGGKPVYREAQEADGPVWRSYDRAPENVWGGS